MLYVDTYKKLFAVAFYQTYLLLWIFVVTLTMLQHIFQGNYCFDNNGRVEGETWNTWSPCISLPIEQLGWNKTDNKIKNKIPKTTHNHRTQTTADHLRSTHISVPLKNLAKIID